jgi:hypothetical protein
MTFYNQSFKSCEDFQANPELIFDQELKLTGASLKQFEAGSPEVLSEHLLDVTPCFISKYLSPTFNLDPDWNEELWNLEDGQISEKEENSSASFWG